MTELPFPKCWKIKTKPHKFCPGCGHPITLKALGWALDELGIQGTTVVGFDIGCSLLAWDFFDVDSFQTHHGRTVPVMIGYKTVSPERICIAYVGDGGAYAIGAQHLVNSALRHDNITVIVVNNTNYAMTGGQKAPTTLPGEVTKTTLEGAGEFHMQGPEMVANSLTQKGDYVARGSIDNPVQLKQFIKRAIENQIANKGFSFVEALSVCPLNWGTDAKETLAKLEKHKKYYPIKEFYK